PQTNSISIVVTDLTAQKKLEEELRQAKMGLEEQVAERTKELRESERRLFRILEHSAADLKAMRRLNEIGTRCARDGEDVAACLKEMLNVAIEISGAEKGSIQLVDGATRELTLIAQHGFDGPSSSFCVDGSPFSACGRAIEAQQRVI